MTATTLWRRAFYVLWAPWTLLVIWYALDDNAPGARAQALWPWLAGSGALAALCALGRGLQWGIQTARARAPTSDAGAPVLQTATSNNAAPPDTTPTLQLRACFARLEDHTPEHLLTQLKGPPAKDALLTDNTTDPSASLAARGMAMQVRLAQAMDTLVSTVPDAAPVPVFTLAPALTRHSRYAAADWPGLMAAQAASNLGPLLLRVLDHNGPSLAPVLTALHERFATTPTLCNAVLLSLDGALIRGHYPGRSPEPGEPPLPNVHDSVVMLWVTRPTLPDVITQQAVDAQRADAVRARQPLARWREVLAEFTDMAPDEPEARVHAAAFTDGVLQECRASDDPAMADLTAMARSLGDDPWHPVPWTTEQVSQYNSAPVLATLPAPLALPLRDAAGNALAPLACEHAIADGWLTACARLPNHPVPVRIWYDSRAEVATNIALRLALRSLSPPLDLDDPTVATDLATRLGPLGGGMGAAALALAAAQGGAHMVVIADGDGGLLLQPLVAPVQTPQPEPAPAPAV